MLWHGLEIPQDTQQPDAKAAKPKANTTTKATSQMILKKQEEPAKKAALLQVTMISPAAAGFSFDD